MLGCRFTEVETQQEPHQQLDRACPGITRFPWNLTLASSLNSLHAEVLRLYAFFSRLHTLMLSKQVAKEIKAPSM